MLSIKGPGSFRGGLSLKSTLNESVGEDRMDTSKYTKLGVDSEMKSKKRKDIQQKVWWNQTA